MFVPGGWLNIGFSLVPCGIAAPIVELFLKAEAVDLVLSDQTHTEAMTQAALTMTRILFMATWSLAVRQQTRIQARGGELVPSARRRYARQNSRRGSFEPANPT